MSPSVTVALLGDKELASSLGKKGTQSDITLYNHVREGHATTLVVPTQFPEKFPPLLQALAMADRAVLAVDRLDRALAETIATLDLLDIGVDLRLGPGVGEEELRRALKGSRLESFPFAPADAARLREEMEGWGAAPAPGPTLARLDHAFPVKGVGAVGLGVVRRGTLRAHDRLRLYPTEKEVEVRSIQVHDVDVPEAGVGERVGVALKGVEAEELFRGQCLAPAGSLEAGARLVGRAPKRCRYYKGTLAPGASVHLSVGLMAVPARVEALDEGAVTVLADRPVPWQKGDPLLLADLSPPAGPRIALRATL